jgi:hypothetical protein
MRPLDDQVIGASYQPQNVHLASTNFPSSLKRVTLLPIIIEGEAPNLGDGKEVMEPLLRQELQKASRFELVTLTAAQVQRWTGAKSWAAEGVLPKDFLNKLKDATGSEAVMFCRLSHYHPYPPLLIGWNMKLVQVSDNKILWAVDEVYDARNDRVVNGARRYQQRQPQHLSNLADSRSILNSPTQFGGFMLESLLNTLPKPQESR